MTLNAGTAFVDILPKLDGFENTLTRSLTGIIGRASGPLSAASGALTKTLTLPLVGIAGASIAAAEKVEGAYNTIIQRTGATGAMLESLKGSFDTIAAGTGASFATVADVMSNLYQRLGLTGKPLEALTRQFLTLQRVAKDGAPTIDAVSRSFAQWSVTTDRQADYLDKIFVASQKSAVPVNVLLDQLNQFGPTLRGVGFNLDQAIALLGTLGKAGVPIEGVMTGLRRFFANAAKEGKAPAQAFKDLTKEIRDLLAAGKDTEALQVGVKAVGARGAAFVQAIKEGRLNVEDMAKAIAGSDGAIVKTGAATETLGVMFKRFLNQATLALAPIGKVLLPVIMQALRDIFPVIQRGVQAFAGLSPHVRTIIVVVGVVIAALGPLIGVIEAVAGAIGFLISPVGLVVVAVAALAAGVIYAYTHFASFRRVVTAFVDFFVNAFHQLKNLFRLFTSRGEGLGGLGEVIDAIFGNTGRLIRPINTFVSAVRTLFRGTLAVAKVVWSAIGEGFGAVLTAAKVVWAAIGAVISAFVNGPLAFVSEQVKVISKFIGAHWEEISTLTKFYWGIVKTIIEVLWADIVGIVKVALAIIGPAISITWAAVLLAFHTTWDVVSTIVKVAWDLIAGIIRTARDVILTIIGVFLDLVTGHWGKAWKDIKDGVGKLIGDIGPAISKAFTALIDGLGHLLEDLLNFGLNLGKKIIEGLVNAIKNGAKAIAGAVGDVLDHIPGGGIIKKGLSLIGLKAGGFITKPTLAVLGEESRREVVLPLDDRERALNLLSQTDLLRPTGGADRSLETGGTRFAQARSAMLSLEAVPVELSLDGKVISRAIIKFVAKDLKEHKVGVAG